MKHLSCYIYDSQFTFTTYWQFLFTGVFLITDSPVRPIFTKLFLRVCDAGVDWDSSVGMVTSYGLEVRDRIPVNARFYAPFQTGLGATQPPSLSRG